MPTYATPGVHFERVDQADVRIAALRTDIAAFVGIAQKGALHKAVAVESWEQFQGAFGAFLPNAYLAYAAKAFFENGGRRMYGVRLGAPQVSTTSNGAQPADGWSSVVKSVSGFVSGALVTVSQESSTTTAGAQPADGKSSVVNAIEGFSVGSLVHVANNGATSSEWHKVMGTDAPSKLIFWDEALEPDLLSGLPLTFETAQKMAVAIIDVNPTTQTLSWSSSLIPAFDLTRTMQFESGAAESTGTLYDVNGEETLRVQAASPGVWGDNLTVSVSQTSLAATTTSAAPQPSSGAYSLVRSVVGFSELTWVRIYQTQSTAVVEYRRVAQVKPATNLIQWNAPLSGAFDFTKEISLETVEFGMTIREGGTVKEIFTGLSMEAKHSRFVEAVINPPGATKAKGPLVGMPSQYIRVKKIASATLPPDNLPDPKGLRFNGGWLNLSGGRDGTAALTAMSFTGDSGSEKKWGIRALEDVDEISIVAAPDILIEPVPAPDHAPLPPAPVDPCARCGAPLPDAAPYSPAPSETVPVFTLNDVEFVQQALLEHCRKMQFRFAILDPPDFGYPRQHVDLGEIQSWRHRFDTFYGAMYCPWILVTDPLASGNRVVRRIPPSGHVAGIYANTDRTMGVFRAPANEEMEWAQDVTAEITPEMQGFLNPIAVNCIRTFAGRGIRVYGARTLSDLAEWRYVNVRRLVFMIEHALQISMQWVVFEPNNFQLWQLVRVSIDGFLNNLWKQGALTGNTSEEAYYVKCNATNNPVALTALGQLNIEIGVAPALPAEFVVFRLGRTEDTLEVSE